jgi:hypothetical protein
VIVRRPQEHAYLKDNPDAGQEYCNGPCNKEQEQYPNDREQNVLAHGLIDLDGLLVNCRFFDETKLPNLFRTRFWRALALALVLSDISDLFQKKLSSKICRTVDISVSINPNRAVLPIQTLITFS